MEVNQSTLGAFKPQVEETTVVPPVENTTAPVIENTIIPDAPPPIDTPPPPPAATETNIPAPAADEVEDFNIPTFQEVAPAPTEPAKQVISWKDMIKDVPEDELAEVLGDDDFIKGMRKHIKNGGAPIDYITAKGVNWEAVSDADIIKSQLRSEFPDATPTQLERLFAKKYNQTDLAEEEDKEDGILLMKSDARKLRSQRIAEQQQFKIADAKPLPQQVIPQPQNTEAQQKTQQYVKYVESHDATKRLFESKRVAIEVADGVKQNFSIANPKALMDIWFDPTALVKYTLTPQGEPDVEMLQEAALFIANRGQFKKAIYNAGIRDGQKQLVAEGQNAGKTGTILPLHPSQGSVGEAFNQGVVVKKLGDVGR